MTPDDPRIIAILARLREAVAEATEAAVLELHELGVDLDDEADEETA